VLRLLRGEDLETVSRGLGVTAATQSGWREAFLAGLSQTFPDQAYKLR
jgi:transposase